MKNLILATTAAILASASVNLFAAQDVSPGQRMTNLKQFDSNNDNMLSKDEFLKAHEAMFDRMTTKNGMIALNDMPAQCMPMMMHRGMMNDGRPGQGGMTNQGDPKP